MLASWMPALLRFRRGVGVPEGRGRRYPSGRQNTAVFVALTIAPFAVAVCLAYLAHLFVLALICGVLTGIGAGV